MKLDDNTRKGLMETAKVAVGFVVVVALLAWLLSGCTVRLAGEYLHHSSAVDFEDLNTSDLLGACALIKMGGRCGPYCPEARACLHWELTGDPVYGRDPVGTVSFIQPFYEVNGGKLIDFRKGRAND
jgi:hypothetical protein